MAYRVYTYRGYRGIKGLSIYRPNTAISHIETLNVSHSGIGGYRARVYKRYQTIPIGIYKAYAGYKGLNGLRLNGLKEKMVWGFFYFEKFTPKEC